MEALTVDSLLNEALLAELGVGLDGIAARIVVLHDGWAAVGADPATLAFLAGLVSDLGWWRGRIDASVGPLSGVL